MRWGYAGTPAELSSGWTPGISGTSLSICPTSTSLTPRHDRPAEVEQLLGDPSLAERLLGWSRLVSFDELVREMVSAQETHREEAVSYAFCLGVVDGKKC